MSSGRENLNEWEFYLLLTSKQDDSDGIQAFILIIIRVAVHSLRKVGENLVDLRLCKSFLLVVAIKMLRLFEY